MNFAIIAAGHGARLAQEGILEPKPLVKVGKERLVDRLLRIFMQHAPSHIYVVVNQEMVSVQEHLKELGKKYPLSVIVKSTPSSMHSLYALMPYLSNTSFCLTTVDTIFDEQLFDRYIKTFKDSPHVDALMAVTSYIEDESPLYVKMDNHTRQVQSFEDHPCDTHYVSGGIYCMRPSIFPILINAVEQGESRMRNFQRALLHAGKCVIAHPMGQILDIDHSCDIQTAELFLQQQDKKVLVVGRSEDHSPNHVSNDAAILSEVSNLLQDQGYTIERFSGKLFAQTEIMHHFKAVVSMAREETVIKRLNTYYQQGISVFNPPDGIINCNRENMTRLLVSKQIPYAPSIIVQTDENIYKHSSCAEWNQYWVKRGDFHAIHKEDVTYARSLEEVAGLLTEYSARGIARAVIQKHLSGDLIKFYGVRDTPFFHWFYPLEAGHTKFGHEQINGKSRHLAFSEEQLKRISDDASQVLNLPIYGGDAIIQSDGTIQIIDFNDWPSFAPCRKAAAQAIAQYITLSIEKMPQY